MVPRAPALYFSILRTRVALGARNAVRGQILIGVRTDARCELAAEGVDVYQYVPYGSECFSYFYRRVRERTENLVFALRGSLN